MKRRLVERYKRFLFTKQNSPEQIKSELMKLIRNSNELLDIDLLDINLNCSIYDEKTVKNSDETSKAEHSQSTIFKLYELIN
jgi:hypothetical protein